MGLAAIVLAGQAAPVFVPPAPPPPRLAHWTAGPVTCGGEKVAWVRAPDPALFMPYGPTAAAPVAYRFTIAADGRTSDIERTTTGYIQGVGDLAPALAASRFAPQARTGCSVVFTSVDEPIATAPIALIFAFAARPQGHCRVRSSTASRRRGAGIASPPHRHRSNGRSRITSRCRSRPARSHGR